MPAAIPIAAAAVSAVGSNMAAGKAADAQVDAANVASGTQRYMYDQSRADQEPWRETGQAGLNQLAMLMGINTAKPYQSLTEAQIRNQLLPQYTSQQNT